VLQFHVTRDLAGSEARWQTKPFSSWPWTTEQIGLCEQTTRHTEPTNFHCHSSEFFLTYASHEFLHFVNQNKHVTLHSIKIQTAIISVRPTVKTRNLISVFSCRYVSDLTLFVNSLVWRDKYNTVSALYIYIYIKRKKEGKEGRKEGRKGGNKERR
jgi:hypothetical protein